MSEQTAAADFAALLRELKDRSGLSYGVLAKRLHMSTSTLHRYCNGDAVPADYAPVERLARLCKARPEELVELHRRWVLADAVRGRKGAAGVPGATGDAASADAPPPEAPPATPVGPTITGPVGEGPAGEGDEAPGTTVTDAGVPAGRATAPARRRTRTAVLAGTAVAAVAAGITFAVGLPGGGGPDGDGDGARNRPVGAAGATAEGTAPASSSPSPSRSTASASPSAKEKAPARTPAASAPADAPSQGSAERSGVPVTVQADPYAWESPCSQRYLADKPASEMKPPPVEEGAASWVAANGAVSSGQQYLRLTVQGTGPETVVIDGLTVRVAGKRAPLAWNDFAMAYPGVGCGGGVPTRAFSVSLDSARPALTPDPGNQDFPFKVSESDPEVYYVTASVSAYDVDWYLELKWSSGDRSGTLTVDDEGRPFRTSGNKGRPAYEFPIGGDGWVPEGTTKLE
ncbi:helix-turn-helix transcriptional regulator [Streptomyces sp. MMS20-AI2-20]|uniref:helix-turn-helix domain-containing protein n=1 Tax=Streptomyces sp. MMS20-AI2-20 TaxID=2925835 RepID=UPI001F621C06|nr:helix-turn-helix transcriptional regulator [Streptomyces sp. MMS20-AI2-20]MCI4142070.1 helix-turn-helix domain-containing protein [Streptomyces sp. MMS20-AI2-20]